VPQFIYCADSPSFSSSWSRSSSRHIEGNETYLDRLYFSDEASFHVYVEQLTCATVRILMMLPNMNVIHRRSVYDALWWKAKLSVYSFLKNLRWLITLLAVMDNTALAQVPMGTVFQLRCAPPHFSRRVCTFLDRGRFLICGWERGAHSCPPHSPGMTPLDFFFWGFGKDIVYREEVKKSGWIAWHNR
jgi:hypothetical protein